MSDRIADTDYFYELMDRLERRVGGPHLLMDFSSVVSPGDKGVYFVFENGEYRVNSAALRVVRVGTHGLTARSRSTIWTRLFEHLMFNGRSVFRDHVGASLSNRAGLSPKGVNNLAARITEHIGNMRFLWVEVDGNDGHKKRKYIESNAIALLSNNLKPIDPPSKCWLGKYRHDPNNHHRNHMKVKKSGLWNVDFTAWKRYDAKFLDVFEKSIENTP